MKVLELAFKRPNCLMDFRAEEKNVEGYDGGRAGRGDNGIIMWQWLYKTYLEGEGLTGEGRIMY